MELMRAVVIGDPPFVLLTTCLLQGSSQDVAFVQNQFCCASKVWQPREFPKKLKAMQENLQEWGKGGRESERER